MIQLYFLGRILYMVSPDGVEFYSLVKNKWTRSILNVSEFRGLWSPKLVSTWNK
jgi:hypothetical protein